MIGMLFHGPEVFDTVTATVVVVAMDHAPDSITPLANGTDVVAGDPIFTV